MSEVGVPPALEAAVESLRDAVTAGRTDIVRRLLDACDSCDGGGTEERKQLINSHCAEDRGTFLHLATKLGHGDIVRALLSGGGDPGVVDSKGDTPPQCATNASVTAVYIEDLLRATAQSDLGRVCQLLAGGLSVNSYDSPVSRNTPLHWAASFADADTLNCLIARGAEVHSVNRYGVTPLHDAVARGDPAVVAALLRHGANPTSPRCTGGRHKGQTPLALAEEKGGEVLTLLQEAVTAGGGAGGRSKSSSTSPRLARHKNNDTLDLRGLAGSLESLNSIGGDSLQLGNSSYSSSGGLFGSRLPPNDTGRVAAAGGGGGGRGGRAGVHQQHLRKSLDMGSFGRNNASSHMANMNTLNIDESIQEIPTESAVLNGAGDGPVFSTDVEDQAKSSTVLMNGHAKGPLEEGDVLNGSAMGKKRQQQQQVMSVRNDTTTPEQRRTQSMCLPRSPIHSTSSLDLSPNMEQVYERLVTDSSSSGPPAPLVTSPHLLQLWPQPRHVTQLSGQPWTVPCLLTVAVLPGSAAVHSVCDVLEVHRSSLEQCGGLRVSLLGAVSARYASSSSSTAAAAVLVCVSPALSTTPLHYTITVTASGVRISCGSLTSLHSALITLAQLLRVHSLTSSSSSGGGTAGDAMTANGWINAKQLQQQLPTHQQHPNSSSSSLLRQTSEPQNLRSTSSSPAPLSRSQSEESTFELASATKQEAAGSGGISAANTNSGAGATSIQVENVVIADSPDVANRAFMLDAAPLARIPTITTMLQVVDTLLSLKFNQIHLMMRLQPASVSNSNISGVGGGAYSSSSVDGVGNSSEGNGVHTNGYTDAADSVAKNIKSASCCCSNCPLPYTSSEVVSLARYCRARGIALVPAFDLDNSWGGSRTSSHTMQDITAAVAAALTHFPDKSFVSIGPALTSVLCSGAASNQSVTNPWESLGVPENSTLIVCANVLQGDDRQHLRQHVPCTALLMEYGFQADYDFSSGRDTAMREGRSMAVCPGTAAWSSLAGFPEAAVSNVYKACVDRGFSGATGSTTCCMVVAHWSTPASLTPLAFMWPALMVGAGLAWNRLTHWDFINSSIGALIDTHLVRVSDCGFGNALVELGRCETWLTREMRSQNNTDLGNLPPASTGPGSTLHQLLADPDSVVLDNLSPEKFGSVLRHIKRSVRGITNNRVINSLWPLMPVAAAELNLSADLMMTACRLGRALVTVGSNPHSNLGMAVVNPGLAHLPPTLRTDIANRLLSLRESYSCLWLHCHQPAGLQASLLLLSSLLARLLPRHDNIHNL